MTSSDLFEVSPVVETVEPAPAAKPPPPHYHEHRERLRARFLKNGAEALPDYELLELILFRSIPRRDVKELAKTLIGRFGSIAEVFAANQERLMEVSGVGPAVAADIKLIHAAAIFAARHELLAKPVLSTSKALAEYLRVVMGLADREEFRVLFLDKQNHLIRDEVLAKGTVDHTPAYPREVARRALELSATALILVHNHPSGDPTPSQADIRMTGEIVAALRPLGIVVHDHVIVGRDRNASLKQLGKM